MTSSEDVVEDVEKASLGGVFEGNNAGEKDLRANVVLLVNAASDFTWFRALFPFGSHGAVFKGGIEGKGFVGFVEGGNGESGVNYHFGLFRSRIANSKAIDNAVGIIHTKFDVVLAFLWLNKTVGAE